MAESKTYQRIVLKMRSPWNLPGETVHDWHCKFSLSGTITMTEADAQATALDLFDPIARLSLTGTSLVGYAYYAAEQSAASFSATFPDGTHGAAGSGYVDLLGNKQQLEVCALCRCPVGRNTRGKEVYLRKWVHGVQASATDPNSLAPLSLAAQDVDKWNTGSGPHKVVPIDPTGGAQGGPWTIETHLFTHQLRRGPRRKKVVPSGLSPSEILQDLAALRALAQSIPAA